MPGFRRKSDSRLKTKARPSLLRTLGRSEPPQTIRIGTRSYLQTRTYKHDSWAATAVYRCQDHQVVCKFNRTAPVFGLPCQWVGRWLARRESWFLKKLTAVRGIPQGYDRVYCEEQLLPNAVAHDFIEGTPLSLVQTSNEFFFSELETLLGELHGRRIAYVDLHKPENVLVGVNGRPYLIDFQISVCLPDFVGFNGLLRMLQASDLYHMNKHRAWRLQNKQFFQIMEAQPPLVDQTSSRHRNPISDASSPASGAAKNSPRQRNGPDRTNRRTRVIPSGWSRSKNAGCLVLSSTLKNVLSQRRNDHRDRQSSRIFLPNRRVIANKTMNTKKITLATFAAAAAMLPNPNTAAIKAMIRNVRAHFNIRTPQNPPQLVVEIIVPERALGLDR